MGPDCVVQQITMITRQRRKQQNPETTTPTQNTVNTFHVRPHRHLYLGKFPGASCTENPPREILKRHENNVPAPKRLGKLHPLLGP